MQLVDSVVEALKGIFPAWKQAFRNHSEESAYKRELLMAMGQLGIGRQAQVQQGMLNARRIASEGRAWIPSGAEFCGWCLPSSGDLGLESIDVAYTAVIASKWESIHPVFRHVCRDNQDTLYQIRRANQSDAKRMFKSLYEQCIQRLRQGETFEHEKAVEHKTNPSGVVRTKAGRDYGNTVLKNLLTEIRG